MKRNVPIMLLLAGAIIVTCPLTLLANQIEEQYKHASELLWAGELKEAQSGFEAVLQRKPKYREKRGETVPGTVSPVPFLLRRMTGLVWGVRFQGGQGEILRFAQNDSGRRRILELSF